LAKTILAASFIINHNATVKRSKIRRTERKDLSKQERPRQSERDTIQRTQSHM